MAVLSQLVKYSLSVTAVTGWAVFVATFGDQYSLKIDSIVFVTVAGFVLSLLLTFKNNAAYGRLVEGQRLFTQLYTSSRGMANLIMMMPAPLESPLSPASVSLSADSPLASDTVDPLTTKRHVRQRERLLDLILLHFASVTALVRKEDLTQNVLVKKIMPLHGARSQLVAGGNAPLYLSTVLAQALVSAGSNGVLDYVQVGSLKPLLNDLNVTRVGLQRIAQTSIPRPYSLHLTLLLWVYVLLLPLELITQFRQHAQYLAPIMTFFIAAIFLGIDSIAQQVEDPFGDDQHDLPLDQYAFDLERELAALKSMGTVDLGMFGLDAQGGFSGKYGDAANFEPVALFADQMNGLMENVFDALNPADVCPAPAAAAPAARPPQQVPVVVGRGSRD
ncbi:Bestrophin, RFP-TM, chloride channel-domain-containing protein [Catenaria anguillulae PL171]|uniref:Bestrophin, RFP-TM, chloride channel-domain-containing protein n=1 Tax=Catenaria anguillulae PL171 TaxID=765915 RepID=A0A1Y2HWZ1_9FUNG|nr:Bestrophin, RFP-TM, chloride channel-domain-containing protein [Catenaria anguillulae PL171]